MELTQEKPKAATGFKMVCDACGSLQIKLTDPTKLGSDTMIHCGRCDAARGTLAELHHLARTSTDVFDI
jgi:hypothetical protein